ncbi:ParB/RepB/Spo0J family partition protein [Sedimentitalea todarodis]|uniref:ParB N-terminal domain-containing protein n=1 Tax=Sedimentitalea todarodis TaxID=1631240 RepID=A0ABU3VKN9_9RHOB|nr:ParB N-terminal domain-containing protein [Sedimentitalea todarodis]MDU9006550.1 ParB N-terminal domain-containing protein [Sedimentitalea todarodis]
MAKRKRLTPAQDGFLQADPGKRGPLSPAPIAQVAGETSASAALAELSDTLRTARTQGRMIEALALDAVDETHLVRDRMIQPDDEEMEALMTSLRARGQQTPIEVVALPAPNGTGSNSTARYGLISGWRRLGALRRLYAVDQDERFATVQARIIRPVDAQAAYVAMVEENEIRAALSLYEKGRIALRAVHEGVYPTPRAALRGLFGSVSRSRRSKIGSFLTLVEPLDSVLRFPVAIPEKLGLGLAKALQEDHGFGSKLGARLRETPPETAEAELKILAAVLRDWTRAQKADTAPGTTPQQAPAPRPRLSGLDSASIAKRLGESRVSVRFNPQAGRIDLTGGGVNADLFAALQDWLKSR